MSIIINNSNVVFGVSPSVQFDPDAQAFITAAAITDSTQQNAVNQLVLDMKTTNIWTKMEVVYPFVGGTATSHKWNLKDPRDLDVAYRLSFYGGVTHNSDGIQGNAVNAYADTYLTHSLTRDTGGISTYILNNIAEDSAAIRVDSGSALISQILPRFNDNISYLRAYSTTNITIPNSDSRGFYGTSRINSSSVTVNFKGVNNAYTNSVGTLNSTYKPYYIMAGNGASGTERFGSHIIAFTTIHSGMSNDDLLNLYNIVENFQTTLGRNV
jgi:hypothetical protein